MVFHVAVSRLESSHERQDQPDFLKNGIQEMREMRLLASRFARQSCLPRMRIAIRRAVRTLPGDQSEAGALRVDCHLQRGMGCPQEPSARFEPLSSVGMEQGRRIGGGSLGLLCRVRRLVSRPTLPQRLRGCRYGRWADRASPGIRRQADPVGQHR